MAKTQKNTIYAVFFDDGKTRICDQQIVDYLKNPQPLPGEKRPPSLNFKTVPMATEEEAFEYIKDRIMVPEPVAPHTKLIVYPILVPDGKDNVKYQFIGYDAGNTSNNICMEMRTIGELKGSIALNMAELKTEAAIIEFAVEYKWKAVQIYRTYPDLPSMRSSATKLYGKYGQHMVNMYHDTINAMAKYIKITLPPIQEAKTRMDYVQSMQAYLRKLDE